MILAVDIGNTHIVIGCIEGERILFVERLYTDTTKSELEYAISFKNIWSCTAFIQRIWTEASSRRWSRRSRGR